MTDCVETTYARNSRGYGRRKVKRYGRVIHLDHVVAWIDAHGCLPPEETSVIMHTCDNPPCVNADHLVAGTRLDNNRDMADKGRARGRFSGRTKCSRGHEYTPENTGVRSDGRGRVCRACRAEDARERRQVIVQSALTNAAPAPILETCPR